MGRAFTGAKLETWLQEQQSRERDAGNRLEAGVNNLLTSGGWQDWLQFANRLPNYSLKNQFLLAAQRPDASQVMSAKQWREVGRHPKKGSTALRIWAPSANRTIPYDDQSEQRRRARFGLVPVFDVSQTGGADLPPRPVPKAPIEGMAPDRMWDALVAFAGERGFTVEMGATGGAAGWTLAGDKRIRIAPQGSEAAQCLALAHEVGHMLLQCGVGDGYEVGAGIPHTGYQETEAESVAFMVADAYQMPGRDWHFEHIASWTANTADPTAAAQESAGRILKAVRPLLVHLDETGVGLRTFATAQSPPPPAPAIFARAGR